MKQALILGSHGKTGLSLMNFLKKEGYEVDTYNDGCPHTLKEELRYDLVAQSPGISFDHPKRCNLLKRGFTIKTDIDIFFEKIRGIPLTILGITGTNGKSTTTTLVDHVLKFFKKRCYMGGNIGIPVLDLPLEEGAFYIFELSSYQLALSKTHPFSMAALLNLTPDHLAWHKSYNHYRLSKEKIYAKATHCIGYDRDHSITLEGRFLKKDKKVLLDLKTLKNIKGIHNYQNVLMMYRILEPYLDIFQIQFALPSFNGISHRQEIIHDDGSTLIINDSKATNADATQRAFETFLDQHIPLYWIAGGLMKEFGIEPLKPYFPKIKKAYFFGADRHNLSQTFGPSFTSPTLETCIQQALKDSHSCQNRIILLSPACASFDQFKNFEERGDCFKKIIKKLFLLEKNIDI